MARPSKHVLRLRRTDNTSEPFLVSVTRAGQRDLDLKLIGTDKSQLFVAAFTEVDTKSYQDRNFRGNSDVWKTLLLFALLAHQPDATLSEPLRGVETVAAISGPTATITIRKNVDGITQRLGTISLQERTSDTEIDTFEWVETAATEADELRSQLTALHALVESQKTSIAKLTTELDMLVRAKKAHEDELLCKFAALLNAKKLKLRDQQRLLNGAQVDSSLAEEVSAARSPLNTRTAGPSRARKRKDAASAPAAEDDDEDDMMNGDETDDSDAGGGRHDQTTPEPVEAEGVTETEGEEQMAPSKVDSRRESSQRRRQRANDRSGRVGVDEDASRHQSTRKVPARSAKESAPAAASNHDEEDEETDDEL